ncbi:Hint domain-containing protein [Rhodopila sp.]|uniref:Hint domain-containing protein n=1 Tax=Rhodopila sp. TaxID=2480087 RepID=UPI003D0F4A52
MADQACYVSGVLVATTKGVVQAEKLTAGDVVFTPLGSRTVKFNVQWSPVELHAERTAPVCLLREAIAPSLPGTDLLVAPWHCLWVRNRLVPATLLINCLTVRRGPVEAVVYSQVQFEQRTQGQLALGSDRVAPIWRTLANRAKRLGYIRTSDNEELNRDVRLVINGKSTNSIEVSGNAWKFILPPGHKVAQLTSSGNAAVVEIVTITQNTYQVISADHPSLTQGWGDCECDDQVMWRHVLGFAQLPISHIVDSGVVIVYLKT